MTRQKQLHWYFVSILVLFFASSCPAQEQSTDFVPKEAFGAVILNIDALKDSPDSEYFPHEIVSAIGKKYYGFDLAEVKSAKLIFGIHDERPQAGPLVGVIIDFKRHFELGDNFKDKGVPTRVDGTDIYFDQNMNMHLVQTAPKTVIFASTEPFALVMAASKNVKNPFTRLLAKAESDKMIQLVVSVEKLKPVLQNLLADSPAPPPFDALNRLSEQVKSIDVSTTLLGGIDLEIEIVANSVNDAKQVQKTIKQMLALAKASALAYMAAEIDDEDIIQRAQFDYAQRLGDKLEKELAPTRKDEVLTIKFKNDIANVGVLTALLLPAVQGAREAARRTQATNGVRQLSLSFHNYHDAKGRFPDQAIKDKKGNKLLSWRVEVLPYLGYEGLYKKFRLDEPWDSDHNIKLLNEMPDIFQNPNGGIPNQTNFLVVSGKGTAFDGRGGKKLSEFKDGSSNSVLFVESDKSIPWTKPEDFEVNWDDPLEGLGSMRPGHFLIGLADGSTKVVSNSVDIKVLRSLFLIDDGK